MRSSMLASAFVLAATCFLTLNANAAEAWFGLPPPGPVVDQPIDFSRTDLPPIPPPSAKDAPDLDGNKAMQYVKDIVEYSYASRAAGDRTWGRLAGSRWAEMTVDYVAREFREAGMQDIVKETVSFSGPMAVATQWKVTVLGIPEFGAGSRDIELQSAFPMTIRTGGGVVSPSAGPLPPQRGVWSVNAPVVYVGAGSEADLATSDVRGRIAIMQIEPAPAVFFAGAARASQRLIQAGAVGVLSIYNVPGNMQLYFGNCVDAPCFNLGGEDGDFLNALIGKAVAAGVLDKLRISLAVTQEEFSGPGHVLVAKVAGLSSAENLLVSAHSDAWFAGANDNASGIAALIALARHYAKGPKPQHDIYFFVSPGHHSPTGGTRRLVELKGALAANNIMTINLEHVAQQATYRSYFNSTRMGTSTSKYGTAYSELVPVNWDSPGRELSGGPLSPAFMRVLADAARRTQFTTLTRINQGPVAELEAIVGAGATGIQDVETSIWFHTSGDTPEKVSPATMQRALYFYRDILDQSDRLTRAQMRKGAVAGGPTADTDR